jgi:carbonic anhydrase
VRDRERRADRALLRVTKKIERKGEIMSLHESCGCGRPGRPRRHVLLGLAAAGTFLGTKQAFAAALTREQRDALSEDEIIARMRRGNERFRRGERKDRNYLKEQEASAKGQHPKAVILSCIDSRAPAEVIMDPGIGEVFNTRLAGNIVDGDVLGGMEFGCKLMGAKVILVMGHTRCGAVKGAIAGAELGNLTGLLEKIKPAVEATRYEGERKASNYDFVDAVAKTNVRLMIELIRKDSDVLRAMETEKAVRIVGAMYDVRTGAVDFPV